MRTSIAFAIAAALATFVTGCASTPTHYAAATDVPMYSQAEWVAMNSEQTVPEIPLGEFGGNDPAMASTAGYSGYYGGGFRGFGASRTFAANSSSAGFTRSSISASSTRGPSGVSAGHASFGGGHSSGHGGGH